MLQNHQRFALFDPKENPGLKNLTSKNCTKIPAPFLFYSGAKPRKQGMKSSMIWLVGICLVLQQDLHGLVVVQVSANGPQKRSRSKSGFFVGKKMSYDKTSGNLT